PEANDFYYYVAKPDGTHAFSRTLQEHNNNIRKYQQGHS
ncbi:MAG: endolytic transglycosylase MltG, partial [Firmicutes bacterium]|nr:endolytic transglycosylase MltG [Bacillota bacterium]